MANDHQMLPVEGELAFTFDYSDVLPGTSPATTVTSIAISAGESPALVTIGTQTDDLANARTTVILSGIAHGQVGVVQALATLSNGEVIPKDITLVGFNA